MVQRSDPGADRPRSRSAVTRVLANAAVLVFASLLVISVASGRLGGGLLWAGALLVFLAPSLERRSDAESPPATGRADALRWCGLALALAGAAVLVF